MLDLVRFMASAQQGRQVLDLCQTDLTLTLQTSMSFFRTQQNISERVARTDTSKVQVELELSLGHQRITFACCRVILLLEKSVFGVATLV